MGGRRFHYVSWEGLIWVRFHGYLGLEMEEWAKKLGKALYTLLTWREPPEDLFEDIFEGINFPRIEDYKPEVVRERAIRNCRGKMRRKRKLKPEDVYALMQLREKGMNWTHIGKELGVSRTAARKMYKKMREISQREFYKPGIVYLL